MPARTFTSAGVNNLWSNAANWDGGLTIPAEDDSVTIPAGQTCEYDYNSAYTTGIAGITITGTGKLMLTRSAGTYRLFMKAAATIGGTGTFDCGASAGDAIPFAAKHTITGGAAWYINGASGLTMTVYAAEPAIKTVLLTALEPIGETVIAVDTDVTGDIWADGDTIRIDNYGTGNVSEQRVIAGGGIAAGTITITAGLTAAKSIGSALHLETRNVKFAGVGASGIVCSGFTAGKLIVAGGQWVTANYRAFSSCVASITGGMFAGNNMVLYLCSNSTISGGIFSGNQYVVNAGATITVSGGWYTGNGYIFFPSSGLTASSINARGNYNVFSNVGITVLSGVMDKTNITFLNVKGSIYGGSITNSNYASDDCQLTIKNATFSGNTRDMNKTIFTAFNTAFSTTEVELYANLSRESYSESLDHDQSAGAFKAWTKGGVTSSQAGTVPTGYTSAMQTVLENATVEGFWQKEYTVGAGASVNITMNLRKSASMTYLPRCIIFNKAATDPFAGGAGISTFTMTNSIDTWEASTYTYYNATAADVTLVIRFQGMNASGNMFSALTVEQINVDLTTVITNLAVVDGIVDSILVDTGTDIPAQISVVQASVDDIAVTGAALNTVAESAVVTRGTETGTYANTNLANGVYHQVAAVNAGGTPWNIDYYYQFDIGTKGVPVEVSILGHLIEGAPPYGGDTVDTYAYNWGGAAWEHISPVSGDFIGSNSTADVTKTMTLLARHVGTGANLGKVRIRLEGTSLESGTALYIDQILIRYAEAISTDVTAILADTNELQTDWVNGGRLDLILDDVLLDTGTTLPASIVGIPDAVHDETFEGTITLRQLERLILAMMAGKASGGGTTTVTFRDQADTKDRITLTVVADTGDRTGTAVDLT